MWRAPGVGARQVIRLHVFDVFNLLFLSCAQASGSAGDVGCAPCQHPGVGEPAAEPLQGYVKKTTLSGICCLAGSTFPEQITIIVGGHLSPDSSPILSPPCKLRRHNSDRLPGLHDWTLRLHPFRPADAGCLAPLRQGSGFFAIALSVSLVASLIGWHVRVSDNFIAILYFCVVGTCITLVAEGLRATLLKAYAAQSVADLLLREMSHRVKNKFAMISSIIGLQARNSTAEEVQRALRDVAARVERPLNSVPVDVSNTASWPVCYAVEPKQGSGVKHPSAWSVIPWSTTQSTSH